MKEENGVKVSQLKQLIGITKQQLLTTKTTSVLRFVLANSAKIVPLEDWKIDAAHQ